MNRAFETVLEMSRDLSALRSAVGVLSWDQETYMPPKGGEGRARTMAALTRVMHQRFSDARFGDLIAAAAGDAALSAEEKALVREVKRDRDRAIKLPEALA